jgi:predicted ATP-grasp superfamily ATP-dependent carboligase
MNVVEQRERAAPRAKAAGAGRLDALVLDADLRQSLVAVRSLGRAGLAVGALTSAGPTAAERSRWCRVAGTLPTSEHPARLVEAVIERADAHGGPVVFASDDGTIEALRDRREEAERHMRIALAAEDALALAVSKPRTLALAEQLGIATPRGVSIESAEELPAALDEIGLPAVLKPIQSWAGTVRLVCRLVTSVGQGMDEAASMLRHGGGALVQEWLPGRREAVSLVVADGTVWGRFAQVAYRTHPPLGGCSVVRESIAVPDDIGAAALELIRASGLEGYAEVEFRRDARGRARLMEINPRLSASVEIASRAGVDFPRLIYDWAVGNSMSRSTDYRLGLRMRWLGGDLRWLRETLVVRPKEPGAPSAARALATFVADTLRPAHYDYVSLRDVSPMLFATRGFLRQAVSRRGEPR